MVQLRVWAAQDVMAANEIDAASSARNVLKVLTTTPREDAEVVYQGKVAGVQKNGVNKTSNHAPVFLSRFPYVEYTVESSPHMEIVQIVLDKKLLHAADEAAKRTRRNRSALVRDALREHLRRLELRASEERDRHGYSLRPHGDAEARGWESEGTWPEE